MLGVHRRIPHVVDSGTPTTSPSSDVSTSDSHQDSTGLPAVEADQHQEVVEDPSTAEPRQVGRERLDEQPFTLSYARSVQQGISDVWLRSGEGERRWRQLREEMIAGLQDSDSGNFVVRERLARSLVRRMMTSRAAQSMTGRATQGLAQEAMPEVPELVMNLLLLPARSQIQRLGMRARRQ